MNKFNETDINKSIPLVAYPLNHTEYTLDNCHKLAHDITRLTIKDIQSNQFKLTQLLIEDDLKHNKKKFFRYWQIMYEKNKA